MKKVRAKAVIASILLHVMIFFLWVSAIRFDLFASAVERELLDTNPLVFELQDIKRPRQVIETPDDAKTVEEQENADYLSDKNALARNSEIDPNVDIGAPFARGDFNVPELPIPQGPQGENGRPNQAENPEKRKDQQDDESSDKGDLYAQRSASEFKRDYLTKSESDKMPGSPETRPRVRYDHQNSRVPDMGPMSFNTYNWDFAPYMLALKRKVEGNIFPPAAFTRLGMIDGQTLLRFRIYPDGRLNHLEVLEYNGHKTLMETSYRAIEVSTRFPHLPAGFPEEYLEVTARFSYFIQRN